MPQAYRLIIGYNFFWMFPGRGGPVAGAQVAAAHPRAQAGVVHPVGPRLHPGGALAPLALRARLAQGLRPAARQPHQHILGVYMLKRRR